MTPTQLAEEIVKAVGDADNNTVFTALAIARLLLEHRHIAQAEFERECMTGEI